MRAISLSRHAAAPVQASRPVVPLDVVKPAIAHLVQPFDLAAVRLLFLGPDCLRHNFRVNAGLPPKARLYGGWEAEGVAGHTPGHYLSACAMMQRSIVDGVKFSGDKE